MAILVAVRQYGGSLPGEEGLGFDRTFQGEWTAVGAKEEARSSERGRCLVPGWWPGRWTEEVVFGLILKAEQRGFADTLAGVG